jgi:hypothetical protein
MRRKVTGISFVRTTTFLRLRSGPTRVDPHLVVVDVGRSAQLRPWPDGCTGSSPWSATASRATSSSHALYRVIATFTRPRKGALSPVMSWRGNNEDPVRFPPTRVRVREFEFARSFGSGDAHVIATEMSGKSSIARFLFAWNRLICSHFTSKVAV